MRAVRNALRTGRADERGFTLIEVLVAATLGLIVLGSTLSILDTFNHQQIAQTRVTESQDYARLAIDRLEWGLRNTASLQSSPALIERASSYDIVFQTDVGTPAGSNTSGTERVRYCVPPDPSPGSSFTEVLYQEIETWTTATAPANPFSTTTCPDTSLPANTTKQIAAWNVVNRYAGGDRGLFYYDGVRSSASPSTVQSLGVDLFVSSTPALTTTWSELRSSVYLRNQGAAPTASFTAVGDSSGVELLNAGTSYSSVGATLSYAWSCTSSNCTSSDYGLSNNQSQVAYWNPGPGTYTVNLTVTDSRGLSSATTQTVIVT